jgi:hypothetical protein
VPPHVLVALRIRGHGQLGHRDPGADEVEPRAGAGETAAADRHQVGKRRESQIAVDRAVELGGVRRRGDELTAVGREPPGPAAALIAAQVQLAAPAVDADLCLEPPRPERVEGVEPVVEPVRLRIDAELNSPRSNPLGS